MYFYVNGLKPDYSGQFSGAANYIGVSETY